LSTQTVLGKDCYKVNNYADATCFRYDAPACQEQFTYETKEECCNKFSGYESKCTVHELQDICYIPTSHYPRSKCELALSTQCKDPNTKTYPTVQHCCGSSFKDGCGDKRDRIKYCWKADSYVGESTCKFVSDYTECTEATTTTYDSEEDCCNNVFNLRGGCTEHQSMNSMAERVDTKLGSGVEFQFTTDVSLYPDLNPTIAKALQEGYKNELVKHYGHMMEKKACSWKSMLENKRLGCDTAQLFAAENDMEFMGHSLISGNFNENPSLFDPKCELKANQTTELPSFCSNGPYIAELTTEDKKTLLLDHIVVDLGHFKGRGQSWNVVSDAVCDCGIHLCSKYVKQNPHKCAVSTLYSGPDQIVYLKKNGFFPDIPNYIQLAFDAARNVDPNAKLGYTDFDIEADSTFDPIRKEKASMVYQLIKILTEKYKTPIDYVGSSTQVDMTYRNYRSYITDMSKQIQKYERLGLDFAFTNFGVKLFGLIYTVEGLKTQALIYRQVLDLCIKEKSCTLFQVGSPANGFTSEFDSFPYLNDRYLTDSLAKEELVNYLKFQSKQAGGISGMP